MSPPHPVGEEEQCAGGQQGKADEHRAAVQRLHPALDGQHQKQGKRTHNDEQNQPAHLECLFRGTGGALSHQLPAHLDELSHHAPDFLPVIDHYSYQRAQMQQHIEEHAALLRRLKSEKVLKQGQMTGAGDGQKLCQTLNQSQNDCAQKGHGNASF